MPTKTVVNGEFKVTIVTNDHKRPLLSSWELTEEELKEFDYIENLPEAYDRFFRYRGEVYDTGEFMACSTLSNHSFPLNEWDGYQSDSYFSGIVIKYTDEYEYVIVGTYYS